MELLTKALAQAREGRLFILEKMDEAISTPRKELNENAPRIHTIKIHPDKVRELIGPGGKVIRGIVADTGCQVDVEDDGTVKIFSSDKANLISAIGMVEYVTQEAEDGRTYDGVIKRITDFGAFVEIFPGTEGLCHVSQFADFRVESVGDFFSEGDEIPVKVIEVDPHGKIRLSYKEAVAGTDKELARPAGSSRGGDNRDRHRDDSRDSRGGHGRKPYTGGPSHGGRGDRDNRR